jgi:glycosyltransferase involved in cell wall biosynthesis
MNKILIILPKLTSAGGVSAYWNSMLSVLKTYKNLEINILEIGGNSKNLLGALLDQLKVYKELRNNYDLVFINPSLGKKSFFRDGLFAKQLIFSKTKFISFFHGWNKEFEKVITNKYSNFFKKSFGKSAKIFVLSNDFKKTILEWGYNKDIIIETTNINKSLLDDFVINSKYLDLESSKKIKILFLARIFKEKGIFELIEAFIRVSKKIDNLELIIAGSGEIENELKKLTLNENNIIYTGHIEGKEKADLFASSHIYCLPSYSEGLPTSLLEAMAFALPIITTPVGGLKDFFQDGRMGYFVDSKNIKQIEDKLIDLISNRSKMKNIGEYNYNFANEKLLNTVVAKRINQYIEEVIDDK